MVARAPARDRIAIRVAPDVQLDHGFRAFVTFCVFRVERSIGRRYHWDIELEPASTGVTSRAVVRGGALELEELGTSFDGALATWNALGRLEDRLREYHAS